MARDCARRRLAGGRVGRGGGGPRHGHRGGGGASNQRAIRPSAATALYTHRDYPPNAQSSSCHGSSMKDDHVSGNVT